MNQLIITLFIRFFQIGACSIGGGYAIIPLIQEEVVNRQHWLTLQEYTDIITISQMTPGPLVVNTASFAGIRIAGIPGAVSATLGSILAGFIISILLYHFFHKHKDIEIISHLLQGLRACSAGLIAAAAATILLITFFGTSTLDVTESTLNQSAIVLFLFSLFFLRKWKVNPILIMIITGVIGIFC